MKKLLLCLTFLLLSGSLLLAQGGGGASVSTIDITAEPGASVLIPIKVSGFSNVGAITIKFQFDTNVLAFEAAQDWDSQADGALAGERSGVLTIVWDGLNGVNISNGTLVNLKFTYKGGSSSLSFLSQSEISDVEGNTISVGYTDGSISQILKYTLKISNTGTGSGQVKVNNTFEALPYTNSFDPNTVVTIEAVAASGSTFSSWNGDLSGSTNPASVTMNSNKSVSAEFTQKVRCTLTINKTGTGSGQVKVNNTLQVLPYSGSFDEGTAVNLEAVAASGSNFSGWDGDMTGLANPTNITMSSDRTISAEFSEIIKYTLTINETGNGSGEVKVNGILETLPYTRTYDPNTVVALEAVAANGNVFTGWSGDLTGNTSPTDIIMDGNKTVSAGFSLKRQTLTINKEGTGSGQVKVNGAIQPLPYTGTFDYNTIVNLEAVAEDGHNFESWSGDLTGSANPASITMNADKTIIAVFTEIVKHTLTINKTGDGLGQVKVNGVLQNLRYTGTFDPGTSVSIEALAAAGSKFKGWSGAISGEMNPASVTMNSAVTISAEFLFAVPEVPVLDTPKNNTDSVSTSLILRWNSVQNATVYHLQLATDSGFTKLIINDSTISVSSRDITGLNYNTNYYWKVAAINNSVKGSYSSICRFKTLVKPVAAPGDLKAEALVAYQIKLAWKDNSENEEGFYIYRKDGDLFSKSLYQKMGKVGQNVTAFLDSTIKTNVTYTYKVCAYTADSAFGYSNEFSITNTLVSVKENISMPYDYKLFQNYPNPFNPSAVISYYLKKDCHVRLTVYNSLGKEISVLVNEFRQSGMNTVTFNGKDISAGVYLYRIETLEESGKRFTDVKKLVLMK